MCNKMSDVRLSNASPTLERVDARQPDAARPPVRRNLFGTPDPDEMRRYLRDTLDESVRSFTETWDFDPVTDQPVTDQPVGDNPVAARNYDWVEVNDAPEFYRRPPHNLQRPREDRNGSRKRSTAAPGACASECKRPHTERDDDDDHNDGKDNRAAIPDGSESELHVQ